jgi:quercetin dioxygenase-like cupin family protein
MLRMTTVNRRDLCIALSSFAALTSALQVASHATAQDEPILSTQKVYPFDQLPVKPGANGETRAVVHGILPTGEAVELHETTLKPGHMPHPAHRHRHSEFMLIREGTVEFNNNGTLQRVGPGGVIFAASNVMHGLKNIGATDAVYFVIAIGHE